MEKKKYNLIWCFSIVITIFLITWFGGYFNNKKEINSDIITQYFEKYQIPLEIKIIPTKYWDFYLNSKYPSQNVSNSIGIYAIHMSEDGYPINVFYIRWGVCNKNLDKMIEHEINHALTKDNNIADREKFICK